MKKTNQPFLINTIMFLFCVHFAMHLNAQKKETKPVKSKPVTEIIDSAKWRAEHYIINRDSAFSDPRTGLKKLMGGNQRFIEGKSIHPRQDSLIIRSLEANQKPFAVIIGCSDSRVSNELIFDQGLGDLFILRTAGQVMAQASYGSIEYAAIYLKSKLIIVLGHTECGAVEVALKKPENPPGHIVTLINAIKPAVSKSSYLMGNPLNNAVRQNVIEQVNELRDLEPILSKRFKDGEILIVGAVYDLHTGKVEFLPETLKNLPSPKAGVTINNNE